MLSTVINLYRESSYYYDEWLEFHRNSVVYICSVSAESGLANVKCKNLNYNLKFFLCFCLMKNLVDSCSAFYDPKLGLNGFRTNCRKICTCYLFKCENKTELNP